MTYQVRLENFSGPFDLLCHLIENAELDICAISLAQVVDQYVSYVTSVEDCTDLNAIGEFLVLAAKLLLLKTKVLLPSNDYLESEATDPSTDQDTEQLVQHLRQYRIFRDLGRSFGELIKKEDTYTPITSIAPVVCDNTKLHSAVDELPTIELDSIVSAWIRLKPLFVRTEPVTIIPEHPTVEEETAALKSYLRSCQSLSFSRYLGNKPCRLRLVTVLLAVLELWRQGKIKVQQITRFGDILVMRKEEAMCRSNR